MVPNPAHSGCESWLQSVWAVVRHLSQASSDVDAFAAPGTCKQLTPQITVICGDARGQPALKLQVSLAPANNTLDSTQLLSTCGQCLKAVAQVSTRIHVCSLAHPHHSKAQIATLRPPHDSNAARMTTWR